MARPKASPPAAAAGPRPKSPALLEIRALEADERAHQALGGVPRIFYHPGYGANGYLAKDGFHPSGVPEGYTLDVAAWEAQGRTGPAPLMPRGINPEETE